MNSGVRGGVSGGGHCLVGVAATQAAGERLRGTPASHRARGRGVGCVNDDGGIAGVGRRWQASRSRQASKARRAKSAAPVRDENWARQRTGGARRQNQGELGKGVYVAYGSPCVGSGVRYPYPSESSLPCIRPNVSCVFGTTHPTPSYPMRSQPLAYCIATPQSSTMISVAKFVLS